MKLGVKLIKSQGVSKPCIFVEIGIKINKITRVTLSLEFLLNIGLKLIKSHLLLKYCLKIIKSKWVSLALSLELVKSQGLSLAFMWKLGLKQIITRGKSCICVKIEVLYNILTAVFSNNVFLLRFQDDGQTIPFL